MLEYTDISGTERASFDSLSFFLSFLLRVLRLLSFITTIPSIYLSIPRWIICSIVITHHSSSPQPLTDRSLTPRTAAPFYYLFYYIYRARSTRSATPRIRRIYPSIHTRCSNTQQQHTRSTAHKRTLRHIPSILPAIRQSSHPTAPI